MLLTLNRLKTPHLTLIVTCANQSQLSKQQRIAAILRTTLTWTIRQHDQ